jgi:hypothetical protein
MEGIQRPGNAVAHVGVVLFHCTQALFRLIELSPQGVALALKGRQALLGSAVLSLRLCLAAS